MATNVQVSYKGKWREVPQNSHAASRCNWHKGADISRHSWFELDGEYARLYDWCKATFNIHHYVIFSDSVWFIEESDAVACQLKWG